MDVGFCKSNTGWVANRAMLIPQTLNTIVLFFLAAWRMLVDNDEYGSVVEIDPKETMDKQYATKCFLKLLDKAVQTYVIHSSPPKPPTDS
jgi:hypothetical protein